MGSQCDHHIPHSNICDTGDDLVGLAIDELLFICGLWILAAEHKHIAHN